MEQIISFKDDGSVTQDRGRMLRRSTNLPELKEKMNDASYPVHELSRLISLEIVSIAQEMSECENDPSLQFKMKGYNDQIKGLRELAKSISETDILSKRDILNFDGEKFKFVFTEIVNAFKKAVKEAGAGDSLQNNIMKHFADIMRMKETDLRRDTAKIELGGNK
jgi:hypothetical protein